MPNRASALRTFKDLREDLDTRCGGDKVKASHVLVSFMDDQDAWGKTDDQLDRIVASASTALIHGNFTSAQEDYINAVAPAIEKQLETTTRGEIRSLDNKVTRLSGIGPFVSGIIQSILGAFIAATIATLLLYNSEFLQDVATNVASGISDIIGDLSKGIENKEGDQ